jgi:hypothetical protein
MPRIIEFVPALIMALNAVISAVLKIGTKFARAVAGAAGIVNVAERSSAVVPKFAL